MKSRGEALRDYVIRRILLMVPTFLGITFVTFTLCQFVPGGQIDQLRMALVGAGAGGELGVGGGANVQLEIPEEQLAQLNEYYGFDDPIPVAYAQWLWDIVRLDFGNSFRYSEPVLTVIADRLPVSIYYGLITAFLTYGICIPLGILKAIKHRTHIDNLTSALIFIGYAIPGFALGAVLSNLFAVRFEIFPLGGFQSAGAEELGLMARTLDIVWHSILPLIAYLVGSFAITTMLMKNSLMENMSADYVKTALAKGLTWRRTERRVPPRDFPDRQFSDRARVQHPGGGAALLRGDSDSRLSRGPGLPRDLERASHGGESRVGPRGGLRGPAGSIRVSE
jgi:microcin C transport system permease protein